MKLSGYQLGLWYVFLFVLSGAFQEVYLGNLLQNRDPILVMTITFLVTGFFFVILQAKNLGDLLSTVGKSIRSVFLLNLTTALSWVGFFLALKYLEPAVASMMCFSSVPVLTILFRKIFRPQGQLLREEIVTSLGLSIILVFLSVSTLRGLSAVGSISFDSAVYGLLMVLTSAVGVMGNTYASKSLKEEGFNAKQVIGVRFWLLIVYGLSSSLMHLESVVPTLMDQKFWLEILIISFATVIAPLYLLQLGIEKLEPITVSFALNTLPILTYLLQLFDQRLVFSYSTLVAVLLSFGLTLYGVLQRSQEKGEGHAKSV